MHFLLNAQMQQSAAQVVEAAQQVVTAPVVTNTPPDQLSLWQLISFGGWWIMGPLALMSIITVYVVIERSIALRKALREERDFMPKVRDYIHEGKIESAQHLCAQSGSPGATMVAKGIQRMGLPTREIEAAMETAGRIEATRLERGITLLSLFAKLAPMFGFIGTIIGVIKIFYDISLTDNISISVISEGLYQKMVTSAAGLLVGIIAFVGFHIVNTLMDRVIARMESTSMAFMDLLQEPTK
jgi:biopolymer transport protein ExbB